MRLVFLLPAASLLACEAKKEECSLQPEASCRGKDFSHQNLRGLDLRKIDLSEAELIGVDLSGANLEGAVMSKSQLAAAILDGASLRGADLSEANMPNVSAKGANFESAKLVGATFGGEFSGANFRDADFSTSVDMHCMGNAPTRPMRRTAKPKLPAEERCAVDAIWGRGMTCPDGTFHEPSGGSNVSCEGRMKAKRDL